MGRRVYDLLHYFIFKPDFSFLQSKFTNYSKQVPQSIMIRFQPNLKHKLEMINFKILNIKKNWNKEWQHYNAYQRERQHCRPWEEMYYSRTVLCLWCLFVSYPIPSRLYNNIKWVRYSQSQHQNMNKWFDNRLRSFASGHTDNFRWQPPWKRPSCTDTWELKVLGPSQ